MPKAAILLAIIAAITFANPNAVAVDTKARLQIAPRQCTVDTLYTGVSQTSVLQPEECRGGGVMPLDGAAPANDNTAAAIHGQTADPVESDDFPGNQAPF